MSLKNNWTKLNNRHNQINKYLNSKYGGPSLTAEDVEPKDRALLTERAEVVRQKAQIERNMSDAEFDAIYGDK